MCLDLHVYNQVISFLFYHVPRFLLADGLLAVLRATGVLISACVHQDLDVKASSVPATAKGRGGEKEMTAYIRNFPANDVRMW